MKAHTYQPKSLVFLSPSAPLLPLSSQRQPSALLSSRPLRSSPFSSLSPSPPSGHFAFPSPSTSLFFPLLRQPLSPSSSLFSTPSRLLFSSSSSLLSRSSAPHASSPARGLEPSSGHSPFIRILTYNILNKNDSWRGGRFPYCQPSNLQLSVRLPRISRELLNLSPDISCLQEVDASSLRFLTRELKPQGHASAVFSAIPSKGGGAGGFGCAILYRRGRVELLHAEAFQFSRLVDRCFPSHASQAKNHYAVALWRSLRDKPNLAVCASFRESSMRSLDLCQQSGGVSRRRGAMCLSACSWTKEKILSLCSSVNLFYIQTSLSATTADKALTGRIFHACSTHLCWSPMDADLKLLQAYILVNTFREYAKSFSSSASRSFAHSSAPSPSPASECKQGEDEEGSPRNEANCAKVEKPEKERGLREGPRQVAQQEDQGRNGDSQREEQTTMHASRTLSAAPALFIGGDFNSLPLVTPTKKKKKKEDGDRATRSEEAFSYSKSGVYQLMTEGAVRHDHPEHPSSFRANLPRDAVPPLSVSSFRSAYHEVLGAEPAYTNYTADFRGCLDYLFFDHATPLAVLSVPDETELKREVALPNSQFPSDHLALMADFSLLSPHSK